MNWFTQTLSSSIGKKLMMAITGLGFIGFLIAHLAGNLTLYGGMDSFNLYAEKLHTMGPVVTLAEFGLLFFAIVHISTGVILFLQNFKARPQAYVVKKSAGGRTIGSMTMPYSGFLILLFVILHLADFHFVDKTGTTIFQIVSQTFANPVYIVVYTVAVVIVAIHVSHGFWSLFQTIGFNHPKYTPTVKGLGIVLSFIFGVGFGFLPLYVAFLS